MPPWIQTDHYRSVSSSGVTCIKLIRAPTRLEAPQNRVAHNCTARKVAFSVNFPSAGAQGEQFTYNPFQA